MTKLKTPGFQHLYKLERWKPMVLENQGNILMIEVRTFLCYAHAGFTVQYSNWKMLQSRVLHWELNASSLFSQFNNTFKFLGDKKKPNKSRSRPLSKQISQTNVMRELDSNLISNQRIFSSRLCNITMISRQYIWVVSPLRKFCSFQFTSSDHQWNACEDFV